MELAGALGEIARETLRHDFRNIRPQEARIILLEGGSRVLAAYPEDLSAKAEKLVSKLGVEVIKNALVDTITGEGVVYKHEDQEISLNAKTVLWAGGVTATPFGRRVAERTRSDSDRAGRIKVKPDLTVPNYPNIFIVGDLALMKDEKDKQLPGVAQVAIQSGRYAGKAIAQRLKGNNDLKPFHYFNKGDMAVIGRAAAVADIFGFHVAGLMAWTIWLFIHLMYIVEFQSRVLVFIQWGFQYLTFSRGARLITGDGDGETPLVSKATRT
jgi:NADH dehydrogenase